MYALLTNRLFFYTNIIFTMHTSDPALHSTFHDQGGLDHTLDLLHISLAKPPGDATYRQLDNKPTSCPELLPAVVKMLRCLVQHDSGLRHRLAHEGPVYYAVLRGE